MKIPIIFEDKDFVVIDKPAGVVVNRSESQKDNETLQDWIESNLELDYTGIEESSDQNEEGYPSEFISRSGIVHRIDKDTSGLLIIAKNDKSFQSIQKQFKKRKVKKKYFTFVFGDFLKREIDSELIVDAAIGRNPNRRDKFAVLADGKPSLTKFILRKVIDFEGTKISLVECIPESGRTHQIRVHLTALGHPVIGDKLYAGRQRVKRFEEHFSRQFLHASEIEFIHPSTGEPVKFKSELPEDMSAMLN